MLLVTGSEPLVPPLATGAVTLMRHRNQLNACVADEELWRDTVSKALAQFGNLHVLVNNAGTIARQGIVGTTVEAWNRTLAVNLTGPLLGMKHCAPAIRDSGGGSIVNISSIYGLCGAGAATAYQGTKGAVRILTKSAAVQYATENIRVNAIMPGAIETPMGAGVPEAFQMVINATPMQRSAKPIEVAYGALFLASDEASFVTGADLSIDGGYATP